MNQQMQITIPYGHSKISFHLTHGHVIATLNPKFKESVKNFEETFLKALENPFGTDAFSNIVSNAKKISVLVDDITRPGPKKQAVKALINYLLKHGIKREDLIIIFATGLHRKHSRKEWTSMLGENIVKTFRIIDHDPDGKWGLKYLGETQKGTPVEINKFVADSDVIVGISYLGIHDFTGYTGGGKIILPGVSSRRSVKKNHILSLDPRSQPGVADGNPAREDIEEAAEIAGYDFSINIPLNYNEEPVGVYAGHFVKAHRAGVALVDELYKVKVSRKVDVLIASCGGFPHDMDFYQAIKSFRYMHKTVNEGGTVILFAECKEGIGSDELEYTLFKMGGDLDFIRNELIRDYTISKWVGWDFLTHASKFDIIVVSENLSSEKFSRIGVKIVKKPDEAIKYVLEKHGRDIEIFLIPYANMTLPVY